MGGHTRAPETWKGAASQHGAELGSALAGKDGFAKLEHTSGLKAPVMERAFTSKTKEKQQKVTEVTSSHYPDSTGATVTICY